MAKKILVLSGKGGVGKSTVTVCLAQAFAEMGKRVLCMDADVGFRSLDLIMRIGAEAVYNWADVISGNVALDEATVKKTEGLYLLCAPNSLSDGVNGEGIEELLKKADESFDYIFIDAPAGFGELHEALAKVSGLVLLVATPDAVCVRSADTAISKALRVNPKAETRMIINRFKKSEVLAGRQLKLDDVIDMTRTQLAGVIPENDSVRLIPGGAPIAPTAQKAFDRTARRLGGEYILFSKRYFS
ncbi:MAG: P-loop NTPase [Clostridia bacterium]|nr:P-loop NTPase [Clostridia bacterium]